MRNPRVINKYNLKVSDIPKLKIADRSKICEPVFWRNDVVNAWCISGKSYEPIYYDIDTFWLGIYDEDADEYAGEIRCFFTSCDDFCGYIFDDFFDFRDIQNEADLKIQEMFLEKINFLLDEGILTK